MQKKAPHTFVRDLDITTAIYYEMLLGISKVHTFLINLTDKYQSLG